MKIVTASVTGLSLHELDNLVLKVEDFQNQNLARQTAEEVFANRVAYLNEMRYYNQVTKTLNRYRSSLNDDTRNDPEA